MRSPPSSLFNIRLQERSFVMAHDHQLDCGTLTKRACLTRETENNGRVSGLLATFHQSSHARDTIVPQKMPASVAFCASGRKPNAQSSPFRVTGSANNGKFERSLWRGELQMNADDSR